MSKCCCRSSSLPVQSHRIAVAGAALPPPAAAQPSPARAFFRAGASPAGPPPARPAPLAPLPLLPYLQRTCSLPMMFLRPRSAAHRAHRQSAAAQHGLRLGALSPTLSPSLPSSLSLSAPQPVVGSTRAIARRTHVCSRLCRGRLGTATGTPPGTRDCARHGLRGTPTADRGARPGRPVAPRVDSGQKARGWRGARGRESGARRAWHARGGKSERLPWDTPGT